MNKKSIHRDLDQEKEELLRLITSTVAPEILEAIEIVNSIQTVSEEPKAIVSYQGAYDANER